MNFLNPPFLLLIAPGLAYNLLSGYDAQHSAYYQYVVPIVPGVFVGTIYSISRLSKGAAQRLGKHLPSWKAKDYQFLGLTLAMTCAVFAFVVDNPVLDRGVVTDAWKQLPNESAVREALALIPSDAKVFTTDPYGSHLSHRRHLGVYCWWCGSGGETGLLEADIALFNLQDLRIATSSVKSMLETCSQQGFGITYEKDGVVILQRGRDDHSAIPGLVAKWSP